MMTGEKSNLLGIIGAAWKAESAMNVAADRCRELAVNALDMCESGALKQSDI